MAANRIGAFYLPVLRRAVPVAALLASMIAPVFLGVRLDPAAGVLLRFLHLLLAGRGKAFPFSRVLLLLQRGLLVGDLLYPAYLGCPGNQNLEVDGTDTHAVHPPCP